MGKKKLRSKYTSRGERNATNPDVLKMVARDVTIVQKHLNKMDAYNHGKRVWMTIPNPNPNETNKRFIRVLARDIYGDPKKRNYIMTGTGEAAKEKKNKKAE